MRARSILVVACVSALLALVLLARWNSRLPDIEIRYEPRQTQSGRIFPGFSQGEGFVCARDGLHAIDVAVSAIGRMQATPLELVLHVGQRDGPVLRRAQITASELPSSDGWAHFEFEPLADSSHVTFYFELISAAGPSSHTPWIRYRGFTHLARAWGDRVVDESARDGELLCLYSDLRALAFAVDGLDAAAAPATLVLSNVADDYELLRCELRPRAPLASGWAFFSFDAVPQSRWRKLRFHLELPPNSRLVGNAEGPSLITFHGGGGIDPRLLGMTCGNELRNDRDLVFRAFSGEGGSTLGTRVIQRGGAKLALAACAWLASIAAAYVALRRNLKAR